jgi:branched-chain amino acid transport system substrate-binding protein
VGTTDMRPLLSSIAGPIQGLLGIFVGEDGIAFGSHAYDLGLTKKYRWAGDGGLAVPANLTRLGAKIEGFVGVDRYVPVFESTLNTPYHRKWFSEVTELIKQDVPQGIAPDRFVQSSYEAMNFLRVGIMESGFKGREDTDKLIAALENLEVHAGDDFPQGDKKLRKEDHQAFTDEFIFQDPERSAPDSHKGPVAGDRPGASVQVRVTAVTEIDTDNVICAAMAPSAASATASAKKESRVLTGEHLPCL